jgi:hypothetical protein
MCQNRRILSEYVMTDHIAKHEFMLNYLVWHQLGEMQAPTPTESDESDEDDQINEMIADIGMEYDIGFENQHPSSEV